MYLFSNNPISYLHPRRCMNLFVSRVRYLYVMLQNSAKCYININFILSLPLSWRDLNPCITHTHTHIQLALTFTDFMNQINMNYKFDGI